MKEYFQNPREGLVKQIYEVVGLAHTGEHICEVGGSVFEREEGLELRVIVPEIARRILLAVEKLEKEDYSDIELLHEFADRVVRGQHEEYPPEARDFVIGLTFAMFGWKLGVKPDLNVKDYGEIFRDLLKASYLVGAEELMFDDEDFVSNFHVHESVQGPSPADIDTTIQREHPMLLFASGKDYMTAGVKVYCLNSGKVEWVEKV